MSVNLFQDGSAVANAGTLTFANDGTYTFTPANNFVGNVSIPYNICDDGTPVVCDTAYLDITVSPLPTKANNVIANNDEYYTQGNPINGNWLTNDADPQGDDFEITEWTYLNAAGVPTTSTTLPSTPLPVSGIDENGNTVLAGTIELDKDGNFTFVPEPGFVGEVPMNYTITDDNTNPATDNADVIITVLADKTGPANDPPIAGDDFSYTRVDIPVDGNFIGNDYDLNDDPISMEDSLGNPITIDPNIPEASKSIINRVPTEKGGEMIFYDNGTYTYIPPTNYVGPDKVVYGICDVTLIAPQPLCTEGTIHLLVGGNSLSGNVFHDGNGLENTAVDGTPIYNAGTNYPQTTDSLYVAVIGASGNVVAFTAVNNDGTYSMDNLPVQSATVVLTSTKPVIGNVVTQTLPGDWANVGEDFGKDNAAGTGINDGTGTGNNAPSTKYDGIINIEFGSSGNISDADFGIELAPGADDKTYVLPTQPHQDDILTLDGLPGNPPLVSGTDAEDGAYSGKTGTINNPLGVVITQLPDSSELYYNGVLVTTADVINKTIFPDPSLFTIKLVDEDYNSTSFKYAYVDAANAIGTPATYEITWAFPLPIKFIEFNATKEDNRVVLSWQIARTTDALSNFEVERSNNGQNWTTIGAVADDNADFKYSYVDEQPLAGSNFYRIKQLDMEEGSYSYSIIRLVTFNYTGNIEVFPNPAQSTLTIKTNSANTSDYRVTDVYGRTVLRGQLSESGQTTLNVSTLASGNYFIRITEGNQSETYKITIVK